jgi:hypothetical protein
MTLPEIVWELSLTIWLIFKGFQLSPILAEEPAPVMQAAS